MSDMNQPHGFDAPASNAFAVTPNDSADLTHAARGLYVGASGDVKVDLVGGDTAVTLVGLAAGVVHPIRVKRVYSTDTTATSIVALY